MLATATPRRQARCLRWRNPPWDEHHPDWLRLHAALPADHRARTIERLVDQLDGATLLPDFCAGFGSAAWPLPLLLKLILYQLDRKILSPAQWYRDCQEHTPLQWLLRGAKPSRATCYEARQRLSPALLEPLNQQLLASARAEGHCAAQRGSLDGTFVAAKGSRHRLLNLARLDKRLDLLEQACAADDSDDAGTAPPRRPRWMARSSAGRCRQRQRYQAARQRLLDKIARHAKQQARRAKKKRQPASRVVICVSEPEAAVGPDKTKVVRPLYDVQLLRDLDSPFVLGYGVFASTTDAGLLPPMLRRSRRQAGTLPTTLLADGIYASVADLHACQDEQVLLYAPLPHKAASKGAAPATAGPSGRLPLPTVAADAEKTPAYYPKEQFVWNETTRTYTCPAGQPLALQTRVHESRVNGGSVLVEIYGTAACTGCPQRSRCTRSKHGRRIKRLAAEPLVEALRQRMASVAGRELYRQRQQTIELAFADFKEHRGLRQLSGYGLRQAESQVGLLVLLHNGKALLQQRQAAQQFSRRPDPTGRPKPDDL